MKTELASIWKTQTTASCQLVALVPLPKIMTITIKLLCILWPVGLTWI